MSKPKVIKKRNWASVAYPESLPLDWKERIINTGLQVAISPLHDKDVNPDGELKKPHYHLIYCFDGPTSYAVVERIAVGLLGGSFPIPLEQVKGMYRYHIHLDNPEKAQYEDKDRTFLNGFNPMDMMEITKSEVVRIKMELQQLILDEGILEYSDLMIEVMKLPSTSYFEVASNNTMFFDKLISSRRNKIRQSESSAMRAYKENLRSKHDAVDNK